MTRQLIIERTLKAINQLPEDKPLEISEFANFVAKQYDESRLSEVMQQIASSSKAFDFLEEEDELYTKADLKEVYTVEG